MKILALGDNLITPEMLKSGLRELEEKGHSVTVRDWSHVSVEELQKDNILVEQHGANAVEIKDPELLKNIEDFDVIVTQFAPIGRILIDRAKSLKYIGVLRGGIENIDKDYAESKGIAVVNTSGRNARAVAEFTVGLILSETRNIARTNAAMHKDIWLKKFPNKDNIPEVGGKTVGIIGFGHIGRLVGQFMKGMDAEVVFYDPYLEKAEGFEKIDKLEELIKKSDIISIHMRVTNQTRHIIDRKMFDLMDKETYFINSARSALVDEKALIDVLKNHRIAGAALDTFENEPLPIDSPLLALDNVTLTSHLAGSTADAFKNTPKLWASRFVQNI